MNKKDSEQNKKTEAKKEAEAQIKEQRRNSQELAQLFTDNVGNRITAALANGMLMAIGKALGFKEPPESKK